MTTVARLGKEDDAGGGAAVSSGGKDGGSRNVVALGIVSLFTDISSEMVFGLLPLFITGQLGASRAVLGMVEGVAEMFGYTIRMASGTVSDKIRKRKPLVLAGYSVSAASKPLFALAGGWGDAFAVRLSDRVGKGIRTAPRDALISDSVPEAKAARAFGIHRSLDQAGAIIGPVLAFALFPYVGFAGVFYLSLAPAAAAVLVLLFFVKERLPQRHEEGQRGAEKGEAATAAGSIRANVHAALSQRRFVAILAIMGVFSLGAFNFSFVLVRGSDLGVSADSVVLLYAVINIAHTLVGFPAGVLADRIGREVVLAISYAAFLASAAAMVWAAGAGASGAYAIAAIYGLYIGIAETVQRAIVPRYVPAHLKGTAYGLYNMVIGFAFLAANMIFGFLLDSSGIASAASYSIATSVIAISAIGAFIALGREKKDPVASMR